MAIKPASVATDPVNYSRDICNAYRITDRCLRQWVANGRFPPPDANIAGRNIWFESTVRKHRSDVLAGRFSQPRKPTPSNTTPSSTGEAA